jgi:hypothetical protein
MLQEDRMKRAYFIHLLQCLTTTFLLSQSNSVHLSNSSAPVAYPSGVSRVSASQADPKAQARILESYGKLPLNFEANHGQADGRVKYVSRTGDYTLFLTEDEAVLALRGSAAKKPAAPKGASSFGGATVSLKRYPDTNPNPATAQSMTGGVLRMKLRNANPAARITGTDELTGTSNYFIGNDSSKWRTKVPTYAKVKYEGIYSGIDLVYYGNQRQLEYDFIVAPGADPGRIAFEVSGAKRIRRDSHGDLVLKMAAGEDEIRWHKPIAYQEKDGARHEMAAHYAITATNRVGFAVTKYDASRPLYIDPLIYSTYLGGSGEDGGVGIAVDSAGNAYVTGWTGSAGFPVTPGAFQTTCNNGGNSCATDSDAFVVKINSSGSAFVYSTFLGGSGAESGASIALDSAGNAYVTGYTTSSDFPTMNPLLPAYGGGYDAFVAKLNPSGSALVYSTYLGGSAGDVGNAIAADSAGNAYVTGWTYSTNFPTINPLQAGFGGKVDAFATKLNPSGSALAYSTYLGGGDEDYGHGIAVDSLGNAYITGYTTSTDFPTTPGAFQTVCNGGIDCYPLQDAFVAKVNPSGSALVYSTYLGGSGYDYGESIAVDNAGSTYVTGYTNSTNFPTKNPLQATKGGSYDAFVTKLNASGSALTYSTYLGGLKVDYGNGIAVDGAGNAYVTGTTASTNFPTMYPLQPKDHGLGDAFVSKLSPTGSALIYSTYLGGSGADQGFGISVDSAGNVYVTGTTSSPNYPTASPLQKKNAGLNDAFVSKIDVRVVTTTSISSSPNPSTHGQAVTFTATVSSKLGAPHDGETVTFKKGTTVLGMGALTGGSASFTTSLLPVGANYIKAVYGGNSTLASSTSKAVQQVVSKATTTTTLASSQNPSNVGQSVTFTATVTPQFSGTVKGTVTFYDGTTALKTVSVIGGVAKFTTSTLTSGTHSITATYNGSVSFDGSSAWLTQTVN